MHDINPSREVRHNRTTVYCTVYVFDRVVTRSNKSVVQYIDAGTWTLRNKL